MADIIAPSLPKYKLKIYAGDRFFTYDYESKLDAINDLQKIFHGMPGGAWDEGTFYPPHSIKRVELIEPGEKTID
jgi:hypothetical protein